MEKTNPFANLLGTLLAGAIAAEIMGKTPGTTPAMKAPEPTEAAKLRESVLSTDAAAGKDIQGLFDKAFADCLMVTVMEFPQDKPGTPTHYSSFDRAYADTPHVYAKVCKSYDPKGDYREAVSALSGDDMYLSNVGKAIALRRAMNLPIPKEYLTAGATMRKALNLEAEEKAKAAKVVTFSPGDFARVKVDRPFGANVKAGDIVRVAEVIGDGRSIMADAISPFGGWAFTIEHLEPIAVSSVPPAVKEKSFAKPGDKVKILTDYADDAHVEAGQAYTVESTDELGMIFVKGKNSAGKDAVWMIAFENYVVTHRAMPITAPADPADPDIYPNGFKVGDKVKKALTGQVYTIERLANCPRCGRPGFYAVGDPEFIHFWSKGYFVKVEPQDKEKFDAAFKKLAEVAAEMESPKPDMAPAAKPTVKVGDTVKLIAKKFHPSNSSRAEIGREYTVAELHRANTGHVRLDIPSCPWVNVDDLEVIPPKPHAYKAGDKVKVTGKTLRPSTSSHAEVGKVYTVKDYSEDSPDRVRLDIPSAPWVNVANIELAPPPEIKAGDFVKVIGKTFAPSESSSAKVGDTYRVEYADGMRLRLNLSHAPFVNKADVELVTPEIKPGDTVKHLFTGDILTVESLTTCACGKPAARIKGKPVTIHLDNLAPYSEPETFERLVSREAKVGETIETLDGRHTVTRRGPCKFCEGPGVYYKDGCGEAFSHDGNYKVVETVKRWEVRPAKVGETIRATENRPNGAGVGKGQELTVVYVIEASSLDKPGSVHATDEKGSKWYIGGDKYEAKNV